MKRSALTIALCFAVLFVFGQKRAIKDAKAEANAEKPNYKEARTLLNPALTDPETKDLAETWYTAGWLENKQFDEENTKQIMGKKPEEVPMYAALLAIKPYFEVADSLDQLPNEKGKVKPKYRKDMRGVLRVNHPYIVNGGAYYFDLKNYAKAYEYFDQYLTTPDMKMFQEEPLISKTDTNYLKVEFYAAIAASQMNDRKRAITHFENLRAADFNPKDTYQYLANEYDQSKDTLNFIRILKEGVGKFPGDSYFLLNLINQYIYTGKKDDAIDYLKTAIDQNPTDAQLYTVLGTLYEEKQQMDKAQEYFDKSLALNPNSAESQANIGRVYFNRGVLLRAKANDISDQKKYAEALVVSNNEFKKALPYFQKAHQLVPKDIDYLTALKGIYYNLGMGKEYDEVEAELSKLGVKE